MTCSTALQFRVSCGPLMLKGSKICHFGILIILSCRQLKTSKCRESLSLNSPYLPKDKSSRKNSSCLKSSPESFINQERLISHQLEVDTTPRQTLSQTIVSLIYSSMGPFNFPKNHFLSLKRPTSLLLFPE